jgi:hypothetical protein
MKKKIGFGTKGLGAICTRNMSLISFKLKKRGRSSHYLVQFIYKIFQ